MLGTILTLALAATPAPDVDCVRPKPIPPAGVPHRKHVVTRYHPHRLFKTEPKPPDENPCEQEIPPAPPVSLLPPEPEVPDVPMVSIPDVPLEMPPELLTPPPLAEAPPEEWESPPVAFGPPIDFPGFGGGGGGGGYIGLPCAVCALPCPPGAIAAVPEPSTWALLAIGAGFIGWRKRSWV